MTGGFPTVGRLAGIDYGTVRIGIAVTDPDQRFSSPLGVYERRKLDDDQQFFLRLVREESIAAFVIGLPVFASGEESAKSRETRQFGKWLHEVTQRPVRYHDERYTSVEAEQILGHGKLTSKRRKARRDMLAAQIMLGAFLESMRQNDSSPGPLDDRTS